MGKDGLKLFAQDWGCSQGGIVLQLSDLLGGPEGGGPGTKVIIS